MSHSDEMEKIGSLFVPAQRGKRVDPKDAAPREIEVAPYTELDVQVAYVFLKKKFAAGALNRPPEVELSPFDPEAGWLAAARRYVIEGKEAQRKLMH